MKLRFISLYTVILTSSLLSCNQATLPVSDMNQFQSQGTIYTEDAAKQAILSGEIGTTANNAIVPIVFDSKGQLLKGLVLENSQNKTYYTSLSTYNKVSIAQSDVKFQTDTVVKEGMKLDDAELSVNNDPLQNPKIFYYDPYELSSNSEVITNSDDFVNINASFSKNCIKESNCWVGRQNNLRNIGRITVNASMQSNPWITTIEVWTKTWLWFAKTCNKQDSFSKNFTLVCDAPRNTYEISIWVKSTGGPNVSVSY